MKKLTVVQKNEIERGIWLKVMQDGVYEENKDVLTSQMKNIIKMFEKGALQIKVPLLKNGQPTSMTISYWNY